MNSGTATGPAASYPTNSQQIRFNMGANDQARILAGRTASNAGYLEIATADD